jgi:uncharacterized SAM-binding protein YcdF (DUF218 family)
MSRRAVFRDRLTRLRAIRVSRRSVVLLAFTAACAWFAAAWLLDRYGRGRAVNERYDAIIVAGSRVHSGGEASPSLERRTLRAVELWKRGVARELIFTGGVGAFPPAEAVVAARLAEQQHVPRDAYRLEERSRSTEENARFTRELIGERRVLVVTDAYHVYRSELIYARYFSQSRIIGVDIGWRPPLFGSCREVAALLYYAIKRTIAATERRGV